CAPIYYDYEAYW
nr:immunoglobulin heavy chain junction region [Mus musculus]MBK4185640.1 immunoglobulin heavy chain junction region [Mus musculus]